MAKKPVIDEVQDEVVESVEKTEGSKTVAMVRDESYPEPRSADVHPDEVDNWKQDGWTEK